MTSRGEIGKKCLSSLFFLKSFMRKFLTLALFSALSLGSASAAGLLVETESFSSKGGWSVDQQFMDLMGSPYLIAHGLGHKVADATTSIQIPEDGTYHVYARTYNWTSPWFEGAGPGAFRIRIAGRTLKQQLGTEGKGWMWQSAGSVRLKAGEVELGLVDLTGFDGRCDAIWLTTDPSALPPSDLSSLEAFRRKNGTLPLFAEDGGEYDLVVIGGGIAGMCAAVTAARLGSKVALVNDRPVLGGNNSSEIRVHLGGKIEIGRYPALGRMIREFGHDVFGNAQPASNYKDQAKTDFVLAEKNISYFPCNRAVAVKKNGARIESVTIRDINTAREVQLRGRVFSDCTGDGTIGFLAGADWRMGREGQAEFGEALAPLLADKMTMGSSVQWYAEDRGRRCKFPEFNYGVQFNDQNCEKTLRGDWNWETGLDKDQINDFERIRDYGLLVVYSNWSYVKNHAAVKEFANKELEWVAYIAGKRESRRLLGDYILSQEDVDKNVFHEDGTFTMSWHMDLHFIDPENSKNFPGREFKAETKNNLIYPYAVPYRCLYSRNVDNLFMAGRDISVTHVVLGSARLMRTTGMMGEVVGMAADLCRRHKATPRQIYWYHLPELKELMEKGAALDAELPDSQHFNEGGHLLKPKVKF